MGAWLAILSAGAFWIGILIEGLGQRGPPMVVALGLVLGGFVGLSFSAALAGGASSSGRRAVRGAAVLLGLLFSFGILGMGWAAAHEATVRGSALSALAGRSVRLEGTLGSDPVDRSLGWTATLNVALVDPSMPGVPRIIAARGQVWIEGPGHPPSLVAGDPIEVTGTLDPPHGTFGDYLRHRGYAGTFSIGELRGLGPPANPVVRAADGLRAALRASIDHVFPRREGGLLLGLALGDTSRLDPMVEEDFRATGLSHLTAVSGENVAMFLAPILGIATWLGLGGRIRFAIGLAAVGFFVLLARAEPSVLRAAVMSGLTMLGVFLGRPRSPPAILGGAVLLLLAVNPTLVYAIGFQLSVAATAGMALLATPLGERMRFLPRGLALATATSLGAQAGVTPLLVYHFGVVPTVTLPANLLAFPAVGPGMVLGLVAAALGLLARPVGGGVAILARLPLGYLEGLAARLARSPLPSITSGGGSLLVLAVEFGAVGVVAWLARRRMRPTRRAWVAVGLILPLFLWSGAIRAGPPGSLTVTFFFVGWGDSALVRSPGGTTILIDGGLDPDLVAKKLAGLGVRRIDLMVATHPHADHLVGLPAVLARIPVGLVIDPGCAATSPFYLDFVRAVEASGVRFEHPRRGATLQVGDVHLDVLGPEHCWSGTASDPNNDSLVLRLTDGPAAVLFGGDAQVENQTDLLRYEGPSLAAPVVKWFHHGGNTNLDQIFSAVRARVAVVSTGPNLYGDPSPVVLAKLAAAGVRVFRTMWRAT